jgi:hypothetical protein
MIPFHKQTDASKQAGQVVNPIPEQFLHQYIEKKDDSPKRITFDEWFKLEYEPIVLTQSEINELRYVWNAALKQGKL